jgi:flagellar biosynthesis protein FlhA
MPDIDSSAGSALRLRSLAIPTLAVAMLFVVLVPVPPMVMDILLAANIALAAVVFLTTIFISTPLEFSVFPSLLLATTLFRLVLNIATTRLILTAGQGGRSAAEAHFAAGHVVWSFSEFVAAGSLTVGVILFCILAVIQFVVITRGAARISEVAARFVLDAMPGKQMAIDADLNAGLIREDEARNRRAEIGQEADFYGAMDGASKFLRGDAVAAVIITLVNICGGLYVGMVQYGWGWSQTAGLFTRLTIGDGLVTQIPALLITVSAALMVTRTTARSNLGEQLVSQLTARPAALVVVAAFLVALMLTSLPTVPLGLLAAGCLLAAWMLHKRRAKPDSDSAESAAKPPADNREDIRRALTVYPLQIDLGYALIQLTDSAREGDLLARIATLRNEIAAELGVVIPQVRIRDDMSLGSNNYAIRLRDVTVGTWRLPADRLLAVGPADVLEKLNSHVVRCPVGDSAGVWIPRQDRTIAEMMNLRIYQPVELIVAHLGGVTRAGAAELLSRQKIGERLEHLKASAGKLVDEVNAKFSTGRIQYVLRQLLAEGVSIRDIETILEALCSAADRDDDPDRQLEIVRASLKPRQTETTSYIPAEVCDEAEAANFETNDGITMGRRVGKSLKTLSGKI